MLLSTLALSFSFSSRCSVASSPSPIKTPPNSPIGGKSFHTRSMASFSTLKPYSLPFAPIKPAYYSSQVALFNVVKKRSDCQNLVLHCATPQFGQFGGVKCHRILRDTVVRSEIAASSAGFSDSSSNSVADPQYISRIRGVCFYLATAVIAIPLFTVMAIMHPFILLSDRYRRRAHYFIAKLWAQFTVWPFYKLEIEGLENLPPNTTPSVYVSNHQSFLDIYTLLTLGRCFKFISKRSIFLYPIIGWAMFLMGVIPLRRMDHRMFCWFSSEVLIAMRGTALLKSKDCLKRCMDLVRKGASVFFFPEGTRSKDGKLGAFKKGAFSVAAKTGVPIVPITLLGTGKLMPSGKEGIINSGSVKVIIHKQIEGSDADAMCNEARSVIAESLLSHGYGVH